jgi:hypothetical protein
MEVKHSLSKVYPPEFTRLRRGGFTVHRTLQFNLQNQRNQRFKNFVLIRENSWLIFCVGACPRESGDVLVALQIYI